MDTKTPTGQERRFNARLTLFGQTLQAGIFAQATPL
jgi:hypothetical protein